MSSNLRIANDAIWPPATQVIVLPDAASTQMLGKQLGQTLAAGSVLLLQGELGSGKTTLVQGIGAGLGIQDAIDSPTFTLINEYLEGRLPLYHFDLYRLDSAAAAALYPEMYWDGIEYELGIVAIEWAERLPNLPQDCLKIRLSAADVTQRHAILSPIGQFNLLPLNSVND